jgi:hypothetical protein
MGQRPSIDGETVVNPVSTNPGVSSPVDRSTGSGSRRTRSRSPFRRRALVVLAVAIVAAVASFVATRPGPTGPTAGLSLAFDPSFSGKTLDTASWDTCYAWFKPAKGCTNFGNAIRDAWYLPSGVHVSGGALDLVATATTTHGFTKSGSPQTYPYTSGMVTTRKSFDFTYGYVQIEAKTPGGAGTWPALWRNHSPVRCAVRRHREPRPPMTRSTG